MSIITGQTNWNISTKYKSSKQKKPITVTIIVFTSHALFTLYMSGWTAKLWMWTVRKKRQMFNWFSKNLKLKANLSWPIMWSFEWMSNLIIVRSTDLNLPYLRGCIGNKFLQRNRRHFRKCDLIVIGKFCHTLQIKNVVIKITLPTVLLKL